MPPQFFVVYHSERSEESQSDVKILRRYRSSE